MNENTLFQQTVIFVTGNVDPKVSKSPNLFDLQRLSLSLKSSKFNRMQSDVLCLFCILDDLKCV